MKIVVVGLGYVGVANAAVLAQHHEVIGVDISVQRVALLNGGKSPIEDQDLPEFLAASDLNLSATTKTTKTNNRKATFATKLFDSKNSLVPLMALLFLKLSKEPAPDDIVPNSDISIYYT